MRVVWLVAQSWHNLRGYHPRSCLPCDEIPQQQWEHSPSLVFCQSQSSQACRTCRVLRYVAGSQDSTQLVLSEIGDFFLLLESSGT